MQLDVPELGPSNSTLTHQRAADTGTQPPVPAAVVTGRTNRAALEAWNLLHYRGNGKENGNYYVAYWGLIGVI